MSTMTIPLTKGAVALVDADDYERLAQHRWQLSFEGYAVRSVQRQGKRFYVMMHRVVDGTPPGLETDHINDNKLDNRKSNLRACTRSQNDAARPKIKGLSRFRGVYLERQTAKWRAEISADGTTKAKMRYLGTFTREEDAAAAYDQAALARFGEFARLNFPPAERCAPR